MAYIIAELGSNHDQQLDRAYNLIYRAKEAGADAVKFQLFRSALLCQRRNIQDIRIRAQLHAYEMPDSWLPELRRVADDLEIDFLCTAYDPWGLEVVNKYVDMHKISSFEAQDSNYVGMVFQTGKPVIMSTGMSDAITVRRTLDHVERENLAYLLHCTSQYPAPVDHANLRAMFELYDLANGRIGLSDHTMTLSCSVAAVAMGGQCIERHVTDDPNRPGPDHSISIDFAEFATMVRMIREVETALGDGVKRPQPGELTQYLARGDRAATGGIVREEDFQAATAAALQNVKWPRRP